VYPAGRVGGVVVVEDCGGVGQGEARRIADQAVTLPTKPPIPFGIFDDALNRKLNDGQDAPSWPGEDFLVGWSGPALHLALYTCPRHHPSRRDDATVSDSPPPDLTNEADSAFVRAAGFVVDTVTATEVAGHVEVGADHHTSEGIVHGGVYCAAIESAAGVGASAAVSDRGQFAVGVSNVTNFLRPVTAGRLTVTASAVQQGRTLQLWSVRVVREDGRAVADGQVRLQNVPFPAAGGKDRSNE